MMEEPGLWSAGAAGSGGADGGRWAGERCRVVGVREHRCPVSWEQPRSGPASRHHVGGGGGLGPGLSEDPAFREKLEMQDVNIENPDLENHQVWFPGRCFRLLI